MHKSRNSFSNRDLSALRLDYSGCSDKKLYCTWMEVENILLMSSSHSSVSISSSIYCSYSASTSLRNSLLGWLELTIWDEWGDGNDYYSIEWVKVIVNERLSLYKIKSIFIESNFQIPLLSVLCQSFENSLNFLEKFDKT